MPVPRNPVLLEILHAHCLIKVYQTSIALHSRTIMSLTSSFWEIEASLSVHIQTVSRKFEQQSTLPLHSNRRNSPTMTGFDSALIIVIAPPLRNMFRTALILGRLSRDVSQIWSIGGRSTQSNEVIDAATGKRRTWFIAALGYLWNLSANCFLQVEGELWRYPKIFVLPWIYRVLLLEIQWRLPFLQVTDKLAVTATQHFVRNHGNKHFQPRLVPVRTRE